MSPTHPRTRSRSKHNTVANKERFTRGAQPGAEETRERTRCWWQGRMRTTHTTQAYRHSHNAPDCAAAGDDARGHKVPPGCVCVFPVFETKRRDKRGGGGVERGGRGCRGEGTIAVCRLVPRERGSREKAIRKIRERSLPVNLLGSLPRCIHSSCSFLTVAASIVLCCFFGATAFLWGL